MTVISVVSKRVDVASGELEAKDAKLVMDELTEETRAA